MGLFRVNEGMHIKGENFSIDIIVVAIGKSGKFREACLEILGINGLNKMCLFPSRDLVSLGHDIHIGILDKKITGDYIRKKLRYVNYEKDELKVRLFHDMPKEYKIEFRRYT